MAYSAGRGLWGFDDPGEYNNFHYWIRGGWFTIEIAMIAVGLIALKFFRFPFVLTIVGVGTIYLSVKLKRNFYRIK